jgi:hypothetical protein
LSSMTEFAQGVCLYTRHMFTAKLSRFRTWNDLQFFPTVANEA